MAQYRFSSQVIGRSTGRSAVAASAYRSGLSLADERTGEIHDFTRRGGVVHAEIIAPANAPEWMLDRAKLWNAVEATEKRKDAQLSREVQLSLPHELDDGQRLELMRGFVHSQFVARGMIADMAIHSPGKEGDDRNHHAHVMLTMRELTGAGFGNKVREWNDKELLQTWREEWAKEQNRVLEKHGFPTRVDHRSLEAQGIDREATQHLGKSAHQMEQRGIPSRIGDENRTVEAANQNRATTYQQAAIVNLDIERHRRQFAEKTAAQVHALEDVLRLSEIDQERRFDRQHLALIETHQKQYGPHEAALRSELAAIDERSRSGGWKKVLRTVTGAAGRDRATAERLTLTLADIAHRKAEAVNTLRSAQQAEREAVKVQQAEKVDRLKTDLAQQGKKREQEITREQRRRAWHDERDRKKDATRQQSAKASPRRDLKPTPEQQAKQLARQHRKYAQDLAPKNPARSRTPEPMPVKKDFDDARRIEALKIEKAPTRPAMVANPAPAPSPAGEAPRLPAKRVQDVPEQTAQKPAFKAPVRPQRDFAAKAPETVAKPVTAPIREAWTAKATPAASPQPAAPAPVPAQPVQSPIQKDWSATTSGSLKDRWSQQAATDRAAEKAKPERDRTKDFDRDR